MSWTSYMTDRFLHINRCKCPSLARVNLLILGTNNTRPQTFWHLSQEVQTGPVSCRVQYHLFLHGNYWQPIPLGSDSSGHSYMFTSPCAPQSLWTDPTGDERNGHLLNGECTWKSGFKGWASAGLDGMFNEWDLAEGEVVRMSGTRKRQEGVLPW